MIIECSRENIEFLKYLGTSFNVNYKFGRHYSDFVYKINAIHPDRFHINKNNTFYRFSEIGVHLTIKVNNIIFSKNLTKLIVS